MPLDTSNLAIQPFLFAMRDVSSGIRGMVHEVILYMDVLAVHPDDFQANFTLTPTIQAAVKC